MTKSKSEKNIQNMLKKNMASEKTWHNTDPPQRLHWFRIILGKLNTIQNPPPNRNNYYITAIVGQHMPSSEEKDLLMAEM